MEINKILKVSATMLQLKDLEDIIRNADTLNDVDNDDLELLMSCVNLVLNSIATDYINLVKTKIVNNTTGKIAWSQISNTPIYKLIKLKNVFGEKITYKIVEDGIECNLGNIQIMYSYFPKEYTYNESIVDFPSKLTERIIAMGVVSEYLFIRGNSDDASIWEDRFKSAMRNVTRVSREVVLPARRWW